MPSHDVVQRQLDRIRQLEELPSDRIHRVGSAQPLASLVPRVLQALGLRLDFEARAASSVAG